MKKKMHSAEQINELLEPWDLSVRELPKPTINTYAYEEAEREKAWDIVALWEGGYKTLYPDDSVLCDFVCHQFDVIEILVNALILANKKIDDKQDIIEILEDQVSMLQE